MTEREIVNVVRSDASPITDFNASHWNGIDPLVLNTCFDKGFLRWSFGKLVVTPLGKRSCGGPL